MSLCRQQLEFAISPWPLLSDFFHWLGLFRGDLLAVVPESWIVRPPVSRERIQQLQRRCPAKGSEARGLHSICPCRFGKSNISVHANENLNTMVILPQEPKRVKIWVVECLLDHIPSKPGCLSVSPGVRIQVSRWVDHAKSPVSRVS